MGSSAKETISSTTSSSPDNNEESMIVRPRILVFGAGGGMGSHLCQFLRHVQQPLVEPKKAPPSPSSRVVVRPYIVGVSKDPDQLLSPPISCDHAIDYTKHDVLEMDEYKKNPFDVIVDLNSHQVFDRLEQQTAMNEST